MPQVASLALRWLLRLVACFGLWMLLIDNVAQPEVVTGIVCAVLAATLATVAIGTRHVGFRLRPGLLRHAWRPLLELFSDSGKLTVALARQLVLRRRVRGRFRAARYRATAGTPEAAARRALTESLGSLAPNRFVIGVDREAQLVLVHELVPDDAPLDRMELG